MKSAFQALTEIYQENPKSPFILAALFEAIVKQSGPEVIKKVELLAKVCNMSTGNTTKDIRISPEVLKIVKEAHYTEGMPYSLKKLQSLLDIDSKAAKELMEKIIHNGWKI